MYKHVYRCMIVHIAVGRKQMFGRMYSWPIVVCPEWFALSVWVIHENIMLSSCQYPNQGLMLV